MTDLEQWKQEHNGNISNVLFDAVEHKYFYLGRELNGITRAVVRRCGKVMPDNSSSLLEVACSYGSQVHKEIENYINKGLEVNTEASKWILEQIEQFDAVAVESEKRVSDFENSASNIDLVLYKTSGDILIDIKTGNFNREYCTLQLNIYRLLYELNYSRKVESLFVFCTKTKRVYKIVKRDYAESIAILSSNKQ